MYQPKKRQSTLLHSSNGYISRQPTITIGSRPFLPIPSLRYRLTRLTRSRHLRLILILSLACLLELLIHSRKYNITPPKKPLDAPFHSQCVEPTPLTSPSSPERENAVIVMLTSNEEVDSAIKTVRSFERMFNRWYHYPVVFFSDKKWSHEFEERVGREVSGNASFEVVGSDLWGWPDWYGEDDKAKARKAMKRNEKDGVLYSGREDYHHMCRFFSGKFYDHPALKPYKWYWRVDSDVEFTCAMPYDPFVAMSNSKKRYGYIMALWEVGKTLPSLFRTVDDYRTQVLQPRHSQASNLWLSLMEASWAPLPIRKLLMSRLKGRTAEGDVWNFCHFWSNFEIADLDWFRGTEYRQFFEMLDRSGGFYHERWGDAPIHSLAAALLLDPSEIHYFRDYGYMHDDIQRCPANAKGGQLQMSTLLGDLPYDEEKEGGIGCRCHCDPESEWLNPTCQNLINRAIGGKEETFGI